MADLEKIASLIERKRGNCINFGAAENAPSAEWIQKAEERLGTALPPTYKWFLMNYRGGEILGDEVFSIYEMPFEDVWGGDIVFKYLVYQKSRTLEPDEIPIMRNDQGELYFLKTSLRDDRGEYPVFVKTGAHIEQYASDFAEFLERIILDYCK